MDKQTTQQQEPAMLTEIKQQCAKVFGQPEGARLLSLLKEYYIITLPCAALVDNMGRPLPEGYGFYREGQNEMIRALERFMHQHKAKMSAKSAQANAEEGGQDGN